MFSPFEKSVIKVLGRRKMTIRQIADKLYSKPEINMYQFTGNTIRRIERKCEFFDLNWTIKGEGAGRHGRTVWKVKRAT